MKVLRRSGRILGSRSGMTLVEAMFAMLLTTMICASLWGATTFVDRLRAQDEMKMLVTNEARIAMEKILWGYKPSSSTDDERNGIREAASFAILSNGTQLSFTDASGTVRQIRLNGTSIEYTEPGLNPAWETLYAPPAGEDAVTTLLFSNSDVSADVVVAELVIGRRIRERWVYASIQSKVFVRN